MCVYVHVCMCMWHVTRQCSGDTAHACVFVVFMYVCGHVCFCVCFVQTCFCVCLYVYACVGCVCVCLYVCACDLSLGSAVGIQNRPLNPVRSQVSFKTDFAK